MHAVLSQASLQECTTCVQVQHARADGQTTGADDRVRTCGDDPDTESRETGGGAPAHARLVVGLVHAWCRTVGCRIARVCVRAYVRAYVPSSSMALRAKRRSDERDAAVHLAFSPPIAPQMLVTML